MKSVHYYTYVRVSGDSYNNFRESIEQETGKRSEVGGSKVAEQFCRKLAAPGRCHS